MTSDTYVKPSGYKTNHRKALIAQGTHHHNTSDYNPAGPSTRWNTSKRKIGQSPLPQDNTRKLNDKEIKQIQKIVGSILYYARAVNMTVLLVLSKIASEQTKGTKHTLEKVYQVLEYLAMHPDAKV